MEEVLRLVATKALDVRSLIEARQRGENAASAYESVAGAARPVAVLLDYEGAEAGAPQRSYKPRPAASAATGRLGVAVIGYGSYFRAALEPLLQAPYRAAWTGEFQEMEEAEARLAKVFGVSMVLIVLLLYLAFHSLLDALVDDDEEAV